VRRGERKPILLLLLVVYIECLRPCAAEPLLPGLTMTCMMLWPERRAAFESTEVCSALRRRSPNLTHAACVLCVPLRASRRSRSLKYAAPITCAQGRAAPEVLKAKRAGSRSVDLGETLSPPHHARSLLLSRATAVSEHALSIARSSIAVTGLSSKFENELVG